MRQRRLKKPVIKLAGFLMCALIVALNLSPSMNAIRELPGDIYPYHESIEGIFGDISAPFSVVSTEDTQSYEVISSIAERFGAPPARNDGESVTIELFGVLPIKKINVHYRDDVYVMPGGESVGVTLKTSGALVVALGSFVNGEGVEICPAQQAGLAAGDTLLAVDGVEIENSEHLMELCAHASGAMELVYSRNGERKTTFIEPEADKTDGAARLGMWVRDSTAGIGTLSFYDMDSMRYGALGHSITDVDIGSMLSIKNGDIIESSILGVSPGEHGVPGEMRGTFSDVSRRLGTIQDNTPFGIFGTLHEQYANPLYPDGVRLGYPDEAHIGAASFLTTIDNGGIGEFECEIIKVYPQSAPDIKGMVVEITDERLIAATGGIVQGMSGSPVIQDGKLIGVITHVFINDPLKGYCIYALWMNELF